MARLVTFVHTKDPKGRSVLLTPDTDPLPVWAAAAIRNPKAWDELPDVPTEAAPDLPPITIGEIKTTSWSEAAAAVAASKPADVEPAEPVEPAEADVATGDADATGDEVEEADTRPAESASKAEWVEYATSRDIDVKGLTKPAIIAKVDAFDLEVEG
ncbi:hypothetical protein SEA_BANTAM_18 [Gordonia phage Bantam]|uniref:Head-to-tail connector protein n=1 Tax=Gordonia phage Bantam TaxID=1887641 RepID=A0A1B3AY82_9CAUD|nr:hypothetical protein BIZ77_gp160 [Gordonia phage Bantam]AOE43708.1 hypothetical protein SEA_BANTAM_18 [Gordonia phage Bantam]